jgi:predicted DsbA family dithiol-disulfide isomerase
MKLSLKLHLAVLVVSYFAIAAKPAIAQQTQSPKSAGRQLIAVVGGKPIYEDELDPLMESQLQDLRNQEYQLKSDTLTTLINQRLLQAAAEKKATTSDKIVTEEVDSKLVDPTDAEVDAYYLGQNPNTTTPPDDVTRTHLRDLLRQARVQLARQQYMQKLWADANVGIILQPPKIAIGYDATRLRGKPNAPITIVEFSDFQCPFCRQSYPVLQQVLTKYPTQVKLAYRDFPLRDLHPQAQLAAEAARCAKEQNKFWEYHDLLFSNPDKLDRPGLLTEARALNLNEKQFVTCLDTDKYASAIDDDVKAGSAAKVEGTPAFFINGVFVPGMQTEAQFEQKINAELVRINGLQAFQGNSANARNSASK